jgi:hypothetical protein
MYDVPNDASQAVGTSLSNILLSTAQKQSSQQPALSEYRNNSICSVDSRKSGPGTRHKYTANSGARGNRPPSSAESGPNFLTVIGTRTSSTQ